LVSHPSMMPMPLDASSFQPRENDGVMSLVGRNVEVSEEREECRELVEGLELPVSASALANLQAEAGADSRIPIGQIECVKDAGSDARAVDAKPMDAYSDTGTRDAVLDTFSTEATFESASVDAGADATVTD
jgi:hypothetical protein